LPSDERPAKKRHASATHRAAPADRGLHPIQSAESSCGGFFNFYFKMFLKPIVTFEGTNNPVMKKIFYLSLIAIAFAGCKTKTSDPRTMSDATLHLTLEPKSGSHVSGTATFRQQRDKVVFTAEIHGLKPGVHAIHIHEKADCSAADGSSAGGHWNPTFKKHGKWGSAEYHRGDIGNFTADESGTGKISLTTDEWCIGCGDQARDIVGKGLIVHEKADDYVTQPTGNAGGRVACSAIIK
jgi:Cu-Zn family superoxide dismutase